MTIARRGALDLGTTATAPTAPRTRGRSRPAPRPLDSPLPAIDLPAGDAVPPTGRLRRCVFRRLDRVAALPQRPARALATYEVMCLYGSGADGPGLALGDVDEARATCEACSAPGIFRPDEA